MTTHTSANPTTQTHPPTDTAVDGDSVVVSETGAPLHPGSDDDDRSWSDQPTLRLASGSAVPALGLGTWQLEGDDATEVVGAALELGVRHLDTAQMYGNEAEVGRAIAESDVDRDQVFVTTKVSNEHHEPSDLVASVEASLERLRTDHVDLLLVHWPNDWERMGATLTALANVQAGGLARHIGVSNFTIDQLEQVRDLAPLEVLQCECHPFLQQHELRRWCVDHDWAFTAYSPLARGDVFDSDVLDAIADRHDTLAAAITIAWLLAQPGVSTIPKTTDLEHLRANWAARDISLDRDELDRIAGLDEGRRLVEPDVAPW